MSGERVERRQKGDGSRRTAAKRTHRPATSQAATARRPEQRARQTGKVDGGRKGQQHAAISTGAPGVARPVRHPNHGPRPVRLKNSARQEQEPDQAPHARTRNGTNREKQTAARKMQLTMKPGESQEACAAVAARKREHGGRRGPRELVSDHALTADAERPRARAMPRRGPPRQIGGVGHRVDGPGGAPVHWPTVRADRRR